MTLACLFCDSELRYISRVTKKQRNVTIFIEVRVSTATSVRFVSILDFVSNRVYFGTCLFWVSISCLFRVYPCLFVSIYRVYFRVYFYSCLFHVFINASMFVPCVRLMLRVRSVPFGWTACKVQPSSYLSDTLTASLLLWALLAYFCLAIPCFALLSFA